MIIVGLLLSSLGFLLFTGFDTVSKYLSHDYSIFQIMAVEFLCATLLLALYNLWNERHALHNAWRIHSKPMQLARGLTQLIGQVLVFIALPHLPLAQFYVVDFCAPIMVAVISLYALKEKPPLYVWLALFVSFAGIVIALRPDESINLWTLAVFAGALVLAVSIVILRKMMETESVAVTTVITSAILAIGSLIPTVFVYQNMQWPAFGWMLLGGAFFAGGQIAITHAFRLAPASLASIPQFLQLIYGAIAGYLVFGEVPTIWIYIGGAMVVIPTAL